MAMILWGPFRDEKLRCAVRDLPDDFPTDFNALAGESIDIDVPGAGETDEQTRKYVLKYLADRNRLPPPQGLGPDEP